ncbi:uncharacterized protein LOC117337858 [Pecten maximus]|uniref:uncharacterized protein LOC117337858 n=1 Tax=Pecten maximus TaxID=6579 RepID=UPI0014591A32|nr:uncharacterized protein LOC117337858 [Pecten maximus]XP_033754880.1 uncharacterized protein LOC117337858 [Pecten maximus]
MELVYSAECIISFWTLLQITHVQGSNTTSSSGSSGASYDASIKLIATICIVIAAIIISVVVAKIADMCYDRHVLRDDASDISDHTKGLIRARLAIIQMKKKEKPKKGTMGMLRIWSAKTKGSNQQPTPNSNASKERSVVINVGEAPKANKDVEKYSPKLDNKSHSTVQNSTVSVEAKKQGVSKSQNSKKVAKSSVPPKTPSKANKNDKGGGARKQAASNDKRVTFREEKNVMEIQSVSTLGAQC